jgi:hypothetical protein
MDVVHADGLGRDLIPPEYHPWNAVEWSMALDGLAANGVDVPALLERWGLDREGPVLLDDERDGWVCGVLAGEIEPRPIPE